MNKPLFNNSQQNGCITYIKIVRNRKGSEHSTGGIIITYVLSSLSFSLLSVTQSLCHRYKPLIANEVRKATRSRIVLVLVQTRSPLAATKFLGIIIDDKLSWKPHIQSVKSKLSSVLSIMYKASKLINTSGNVLFIVSSILILL